MACTWGISSVGRALAWHARGQGFKSPILHYLLHYKLIESVLVSVFSLFVPPSAIGGQLADRQRFIQRPYDGGLGLRQFFSIKRSSTASRPLKANEKRLFNPSFLNLSNSKWEILAGSFFVSYACRAWLRLRTSISVANKHGGWWGTNP